MVVQGELVFSVSVMTIFCINDYYYERSKKSIKVKNVEIYASKHIYSTFFCAI